MDKKRSEQIKRKIQGRAARIAADRKAEEQRRRRTERRRQHQQIQGLIDEAWQLQSAKAAPSVPPINLASIVDHKKLVSMIFASALSAALKEESHKALTVSEPALTSGPSDSPSSWEDLRAALGDTICDQLRGGGHE